MKRFLPIFAAVIVVTAVFHEMGHALAGWVQGIAIVPTPFKEYTLRPEVPWHQYRWIALGGIVGTLFTVAIAGVWFCTRRSLERDAAFAGALLTPAAYSLRYLVAGRGHDGLEWQAAQSALGFAPSGHALDVILLVVTALGTMTWIACRRPRVRLAGLAKGIGTFLVGLLVLVLGQVGNNALFDGIFRDRV